jgi:hypothetical protein
MTTFAVTSVFTPLPSFDLLSHGLKVSLHAVNAHREAVNQ